MIDTKNNYSNIKSNASVSKENKFIESSEDENKAILSISEGNNEIFDSESSSLQDNHSFEMTNEIEKVGIFENSCSSLDGCDFVTKDDKIDKNELIYDSEETSESESYTENSTEDGEESIDDNDADTSNNFLMQQHWNELDKYGSSSQVRQNSDNHNIFRQITPVNLSITSSEINQHLTESALLNRDYCHIDPSVDIDSFMLGINSHLSKNEVNMSTLQTLPFKNMHLDSPETGLHYNLNAPKVYKTDLINDRLQHLNSNIPFNIPPFNYDYGKEQRLLINHPQFSSNDIRSPFHLNMMTSGHEIDSLPPYAFSDSHLQDLRCTYCNKCYTNQSSLRSHLKKHMNVEEKKYQCDKCSYSSQYQKNLLKHIHINHEDLHEINQIRCDVCDRIFPNEFVLKDHLRMHMNDNTYQCQQCGKKLKTKLKLRYHADVHNPEKPYICDVDNCDRAFRTPKYLKNHKDEFHKLQPKKYFCPVDNCKLVFQRKSHLKRHMVMHDGEKNYHCHWPDCNRSFRSQETLNVHLVRHTGEKPYKCVLCEYSCRQKSSLNYHCRNAHPNDCERLLGLKPFPDDGRPPGPRPVGRPPRNRLDSNYPLNSPLKVNKPNESNSKPKSEYGIMSYLNQDPSILEVFKRPETTDESDFMRAMVFMLADDVLSNPPRTYEDVKEFSLEELCIIELSIKSKRGRKRKVLKELDALLAQNVNNNNIIYEEEDDDDCDSYKDSNNIPGKDEALVPRSPIDISDPKYIPPIVQSHSNSTINVTGYTPRSFNLTSVNYSDVPAKRFEPKLSNRVYDITADLNKIDTNATNNSIKSVDNFLSSLSSLNKTVSQSDGVTSFNTNYILGNYSNTYNQGNESSSSSNTSRSDLVKTEFDDLYDNDDNSNDVHVSKLPTNLASPTFPKVGNKSPEGESSIIKKIQEFDFEKPCNTLDNFDDIKRHSNSADQVFDDLNITTEKELLKSVLSPSSTKLLSSVNILSSNISDVNVLLDNELKVLKGSLINSQSLGLSPDNKKSQSIVLDSSLLSDSGLQIDNHDCKALNKDTASNRNSVMLSPCMSSLSTSATTTNNSISSPSAKAAAAFIEKTAVAAEMAALSASAALLNSDFYTSYQHNIVDDNSTVMDSNFGHCDNSGLNSQLCSMNNICSTMYKSELEDHLLSLTSRGSRYSDNNGYHQGISRSDSNIENKGMNAFSHLWSNVSMQHNDYLAISRGESSSGPSTNLFDSGNNVRNSVGDYCNPSQSPTATAAADFYSQMTASANYDKYPGLYGCRDNNFYDNSVNVARGISALNNNVSDHYGERNCLSSTHPFYPEISSRQYCNRYVTPGASATDYLPMSRQFPASGSSGNLFSVVNDPYRQSMLNNMSPFNRYPF